MGQEDKEFLLHEGGGKSTGASVESLNAQGAANTNVEETSLNIDVPRGYGALACTNTHHEQLIYTWQNLDIFAEVPQVGSTWKIAKNRVRGVFCKERHIPAPRKHIIKNVSGVAYPGELLAVMGSSGAGKTTLLNSLAFRSSQNVQVSPAALRMLNGTPVDAREMHARCAYVQQDDLFIGALTVREHLLFQARLRLPRSLSYKQKVQRVDEVIRDLSLTKCKNTLIGTPGRIKGLSGGERKRLAFASEALTDPPLLICDEPTSGLDSFMAYNVVQVLKNISLKGKTTILTIHQPSSEIFELFDKILLMAQGRVAFLGTTNEAMDFFSYIGAECPTNYNPADFYVQILAVVPGKEGKCKERIGKICDNFAVSKMAREMEDNVKKIVAKASSLEITTNEDVFAYKASWFAQLRAVLWRSALSVIKEPLLVKVRLIQTVMVAVILGSIFYGQKLDETGVMNINGAIFLFLTNMTFQNVFAVITVFTSEMPVFLREVQSRLYRVDTYFLGKSLAELPLFLLVPFILTSITYPLIGLRAGLDHFLTTLALVTLVANVATSFGYLISCASSSTSMALSAGPPLIIPLLLFGGYFLNNASIPVYIKWLSYFSWFRYANEGLLINQWADVKEGEITCGLTNITCPKSGKVVLQTLNFTIEDFPWDIVGLVMLIVVFRLAAYLVLKWRVKQIY